MSIAPLWLRPRFTLGGVVRWKHNFGIWLCFCAGSLAPTFYSVSSEAAGGYTWGIACTSSCSPAYTNSGYGSPSAAVQAFIAWANGQVTSGYTNKCAAPGASAVCGTWTWSGALTAGTFPAYSITSNSITYGATASCTGTPETCSTGATTDYGGGVTLSATATSSQTCPASGTHIGVAVPSANWSQWSSLGSGTLMCNTGSPSGTGDNCVYSTGNPQVAIAPPGGSGQYIADAYATGESCGATAATTPGVSGGIPAPTGGTASNVPACVNNSGTEACDVSGANGATCGTFNGDEVCPSAVPNNSCVAFPSGGTACVATVASPPAPNNGTPGTVATPSGSVTSGSTTVNYFSSSTTSSSTITPTTVNANNGGNPTGTGGSGSSGGGSSGSVTVSGSVATTDADAASNGDCSAGGCSGSVPGALDVSGLSYAGVFSTFWSSVQSAPIVSGAAAIESAWPAGSCSLSSVTLTTLPGVTLDYGTPFCNVWNTDAGPAVATVALVAYALIGIFILLSA